PHLDRRLGYRADRAAAGRPARAYALAVAVARRVRRRVGRDARAGVPGLPGRAARHSPPDRGRPHQLATRADPPAPGCHEGRGAMTADVLLREVLDLPESVHAGDFKIDLTRGFTDVEARVAEYVVTDQLAQALRKALNLVRSAVRDGTSHAAYLHGSFRSGHSHFLAVLNAILNGHPAAHRKPALQPVIAEHAQWLPGRRFFTVPYHLVGASDLDSAILGGYVRAVREQHPEVPVPPVYRADALLADARRHRERGGDGSFVEWLGGQRPADPEDVAPLGPPPPPRRSPAPPARPLAP